MTHITELINSKDVVFIPSWIYAIAERNRLPLEKLLDYDTFKQYLSENDQINLILTQKLVCALFGIEDGVHKLILRLTNNGMASENSTTDIQNLLLVAENQHVLKELKQRLFNESALTLQGESKEPQVYDIDRNTLALIVSPGDYYFDNGLLTSSSMDFLIRAMESVLKQLYVYLPQAVVQATVWFKCYVSLLAKQKRYSKE